MRPQQVHRWLLDQLESEGQIDHETIQQALEDDTEHALFFLEYGVQEGFVKREESADAREYSPIDIEALRSILSEEVSAVPQTELESGLVISVPPSIRGEIETARQKHPEANIFTLRQTLGRLLADADEIIRIASPFFERSGLDYYLDEVIDLAECGASIHILTRDILDPPGYQERSQIEKRQAFGKLIDLFEQHRSDPEAEVRIADFGKEVVGDGGRSRHYEGVHQKMVIADSNTAYVGSGEFRRNSLITNGEAGVIQTDSETVSFWSDFFDVFWNRANQVSHERIRRID